MKHWLFAAILGALLLTGCTRHYVMTLNNGHRITTIGKPQLQGDNYSFTDITGQAGSVSTTRVREVAPASMTGSTYSSGYKAGPSQ